MSSKSNLATFEVQRARNAKEPSAKKDNHPAALAAKIEIRRNVLTEMGKDAAVLDLYCGRGAMYRSVWKDAATYAGCDLRPWEPTDPPRFVADNQRLLRSLDLSRYNVFDLDAYGSPWPQMEVLLHRRTWAPGERGAFIVTDGSTKALAFGNRNEVVFRLSGIAKGASTKAGAETVQRVLIEKWLEKARVKAVKSWRARGGFAGAAGQAGGDGALYQGVVFVGV